MNIRTKATLDKTPQSYLQFIIYIFTSNITVFYDLHIVNIFIINT